MKRSGRKSAASSPQYSPEKQRVRLQDPKEFNAVWGNSLLKCVPIMSKTFDSNMRNKFHADVPASLTTRAPAGTAIDVPLLPGPAPHRALEWRTVSFTATLGRRGATGKCLKLSRNTASVYSLFEIINNNSKNLEKPLTSFEKFSND